MQFEQSTTVRDCRASLAFIATLALFLTAAHATTASAATLERIHESGHIRLGYLVDARPFTYKTDDGSADGYAIALCSRIADAVKKQLAMPQLTVDWVPVPLDTRFDEVKQGRIDLLCTPANASLSHRQDASFSTPTFAGGVRAVMRADGPVTLRDALTETTTSHVVWRGSPAAKTLSATTVAVVKGTTTEHWLESRIASLEIGARTVLVPDYRTGLQQLLDHKVDVFFGDRSLVLGAMDTATAKNLVILDRLFTHEALALALARGDDEFRLLVDRTLNETYVSGEFPALYAKWFGEFNDNTRLFFAWNTSE